MRMRRFFSGTAPCPSRYGVVTATDLGGHPCDLCGVKGSLLVTEEPTKEQQLQVVEQERAYQPGYSEVDPKLDRLTQASISASR